MGKKDYENWDYPVLDDRDKKLPFYRRPSHYILHGGLALAATAAVGLIIGNGDRPKPHYGLGRAPQLTYSQEAHRIQSELNDPNDNRVARDINLDATYAATNAALLEAAAPSQCNAGPTEAPIELKDNGNFTYDAQACVKNGIFHLRVFRYPDSEFIALNGLYHGPTHGSLEVERPDHTTGAYDLRFVPQGHIITNDIYGAPGQTSNEAQYIPFSNEYSHGIASAGTLSNQNDTAINQFSVNN